jgi:hypothetical protein
MTTTAPTQTFENRVGFYWTCIMLAEVLSDEPIDEADPSNLRADASIDGLTFVQISRTLQDGTYLARVAASEKHVTTGYTVILGEEQLYFALPYDQTTSLVCSDAKRHRAEEVRTLLRSHAAEVRPLVKVEPHLQHEPAVPLTLTDTVMISEKALWETMEKVCPTSDLAQARPFQIQQALLCAMLDTLMSQMYSGLEKTQAQILQARCHLVMLAQRIHRQTRQQLVQAQPRYDTGQRCMFWKLSLGMPLSATIA